MSLIHAVTSLSPSPGAVEVQRACLASWKRAGLRVIAVNAPTEAVALRNTYDIEVIPAERTTEAQFERPCAPIDYMLKLVQRAHGNDARILLINADIEIRLSVAELGNIEEQTRGGLCIIPRWDHDSQDPSTHSHWPLSILWVEEVPLLPCWLL